MSEIIISESYTKAVTLHRRICANAQAAQESLYEMCKALKEMRDGKLYKELGYSNFEDYTENEVGISRFMAYKYTAIAEMKNVESIQQIGVTKLALLAKLDEPERTEITQNTDLESITVKALKEKIKKLEEQNESTRSSNVSLLKRNSELTAENNSLSMDRKEYLHKADELKKQIREQQSNYSMHTKRREDRIAELESQVEELENRPIEIAVQESHEVENMRKAMEKLNEDIARQDAEIQAEHEERIRSLRQTHAQEIESLKKEYEQKLREVPKQEQISDQKEVFKAYLSIAVDASKRLTEFVKSSPDDFFKAKTKELFTKLLQEVEYETI